MKKWKLGFIALVSIVLVLAACSNTDDNAKTNNKQNETKQQETMKPSKNRQFKLKNRVDFLGLIVTFEKATYLQNDKGVKDSVLKVDMNVENNSATPRGFTTINMEISDKDGKKLTIYPGENLGEKIEPGKTIHGSGYFAVNGKGPYTISYKDQDSDVQASWKVEVK
ncbi:DUF4352 domain-containing protein [Listeria booriae]|uniref:DUF4352 domain-containing protein n=1 Tax=Listeria booriae TaxID=1552123 RepID=A0A841YM69_9LIST|nr:DUF4352 domain-containing protein [Listeria booriae]MBC1401330.1 DUF4352 domain-containing protein [Listeria booriae]MBC1616343.1 DUF4352 domain-containing protein [Listeria booriae]